MASLWTAADQLVVEQLTQLLDERERCREAVKGKRLVEGSQGQPRLNPLLKYIGDLDAEIRQLRDRLGLTPKARLALGIAVGQVRKDLDALNRELEPDWGSADGPVLVDGDE